MRKDLYLMLVRETGEKDFPKYFGSLDDVVNSLYQNHNVVQKIKVEVYDDKLRQVDIFEMPFLFFYRPGYLFVKINVPAYNYYTIRLSKEAKKSEYVVEGFVKHPVKEKGKWNAFEIFSIDYQGTAYRLVVVINTD